MIQLLNSQHPKGETLTFTCLINFVNFFTDLCVFRIFFSLLTSNHLTVAITITIRNYEGAREWKWENHFHYSMKINYFVIIFQFICSQSDSWPLRGVISNLTLENISHWTDSMFALIANLFPINLLFSVGQTNAETLLRVRFRSDPSVDWMNAEYWTAASVGYDDRCGWSHRARYTLKVPSRFVAFAAVAFVSSFLCKRMKYDSVCTLRFLMEGRESGKPCGSSCGRQRKDGEW